MRIVDAHHHLWDPVSNASGIGYSWLRDIGAPKPFGDPTPIQRDYLADEYRAETAHDLVASVHVQCDGGLPDPVAETAWLDGVAETHGLPSAIVAFVDLSRADAPETIARHVKASKRLRGIRHIIARTEGRPDISFAPVEWLEDETWRANYALLAEHGLSFDLQLHPAQMHAASEWAAKNLGVPVVIDHAGSPFDRSPEGLRDWREGMVALAALPHVDCKISGLGMFEADWSAESMAPVIDGILELFGPARTMFGSNFPVDKLFGPFDAIVERIASRVPAEHHADLFERTALRAYRLARG